MKGRGEERMKEPRDGREVRGCESTRACSAFVCSFVRSFIRPFVHSYLRPFVLSLILSLVATGCDGPQASSSAQAPDSMQAAQQDTVRTGAAVLAADDMARLQNKTIGLVVNHTAMVDSTHLIDLVDRAPNVELGALFGPEHGLRGEAEAGEEVKDGRDAKTGAPIYSLYGDTRVPQSKMLDGLDALVFDIQDVGARFYTYISTMGLAMQAAAQNDVDFMVLDRPNPIGGEHVSGFVLDTTYQSFVGKYPIPVQHGMTAGELARMIKGEAWLSGLDALDLEVVSAENWSRGKLRPEMHLPWIAPSPNIPDFETALVYPGAAFFEATAASEGRGTDAPFKLVGASWADPQVLAGALDARGLPGVRFEPATFTPESEDLAGKQAKGVRHVITDAEAYRPVATGVHVLHAFYQRAPEPDSFLTRPDWLAKLSGTDRFLEMLEAGKRPEAIIRSWQSEVKAFRERRKPYLLY